MVKISSVSATDKVFQPMRPRLCISFRLKSTLRDIQSCREYLEYGRLNQKDIFSPTFRGTLYELQTKEHLEEQFKCYDMTRVGGANDNGIDIFGKWNLAYYWDQLLDEQKSIKYPKNSIIANSSQQSSFCNKGSNKSIDMRSQIDVLVQCKNYRRRLQAKTIRELSGIYHYHAKSTLDRMKTFFFLLLPFVLTEQGHRQFDASEIPLIHMRITPLETGEIEGLQGDSKEPARIYMNRKARRLLNGLETKILED